MINNITPNDIYDAGYAIPTYSINFEKHNFKFKDKNYIADFNKLKRYNYPGIDFVLVKIDELIRLEWMG